MIEIRQNKIRVEIESGDGIDGFVHVSQGADFNEWNDDELVDFVNERLTEHQITTDDIEQS